MPRLVLRLHSRGSEVSAAQTALKAAGATLSVDGVFGQSTDRAVRIFQRRNGLLPDGIVGPATQRHLQPPQSGAVPPRTARDIRISLVELTHKVGPAVLPPATAALAHPPLPGAKLPVQGMTQSANGRQFLYALEAQKGVSDHLYWPAGASGVTLGAGYDMKARSAPAITQDMREIGLAPNQAAMAAQGAGLTGATDAAGFARRNRNAIVLTPAQETRLLTLVVPTYEAIVKRHIAVELLQHEFDALVSFAYNPGGSFSQVATLINSAHVAQAMALMKRRIYSAGRVLTGLIRRRDLEVNLYLYGSYVGS